jgi:AcrR family transcriptional regulator
MPYPSEHHLEKRQQLVRIARRLFNRKGFEGVSIDDIMAQAGLTRGGFYSYFTSKSDLYALAVEDALIHPWVVTYACDATALDAAQQVISAYLSKAHFDDFDDPRPMISLPTDVARCDVVVKRVFETVFCGMVGLFEKSLERDGRADRERALTMTTLCVGAMVIARALADSQLADELRSAAKRLTLELGGWSAGEADRERGYGRPFPETEVGPHKTGPRGVSKNP